jgi:hypothetical protein
MKVSDIANIRLQHQQIAHTAFKKAKDLVAWMGAMQSQDYNMAKWAIGIRLPNATQKTIEAAIHKGEIIRTHILRPTWHFVSAEDIHWMLALSAPKLKASLKARHNELELSEAVRKKSNTIIEKALTKNGHLTRVELVTALKNAKISVDNNRSSHLLFWAEMEGLICSGSLKENEPTYALLNQWVPNKKTFNKDEALASLTHKYFHSHSPATLADFVWWSGLNISEAKHGLEMIKNGLVTETIGNHTYWLPNGFAIPKKQSSVYFLPAYDEYIISYKDRTAILPFINHKKAISDNGLFRPVIVINGKAAGIWKRTIKKDKVIIETQYFEAPPKTVKKSIEKAAAAYGDFMELKTEIKQSA